MSNICEVYNRMTLFLKEDNLNLRELKRACDEYLKFVPGGNPGEDVYKKLHKDVAEHCNVCEEHTKADMQSPLGNCDLIMDQTKSGCGCAFSGYLIRKGCPLGKFKTNTECDSACPDTDLQHVHVGG